ncbi:hypothetical protein AX16_005008 [Volvariella volvacea WC 439]|nr:hypothetical protein AX16_005008 [Volvariella volvacea WC 439]
MGLDLVQVQKALLIGRWRDQGPGAADLAAYPVVQSVKGVINGSLRGVLTSPPARSVLEIPSHKIHSIRDQPFEHFLGLSIPQSGDVTQHELLRLTLAVACLHAFVQVNWTGPDLDVQPVEIILPTQSLSRGQADQSSSTATSTSGSLPDSITNEILDKRAISELAYGGEPAYHLAKFPSFLRIAQLLLALPFKHLPSVSWWRLRSTFLHQQILDEPVPRSQSLLTDLDSNLSSQDWFREDPELEGEKFLEQGLLEHQVGQDKSAAEYFVKAARATGLQYELTGAIGKRTKFQQTGVTQLVLLAESKLKANDGNDAEAKDTANGKELTNGTSSDAGAEGTKYIPTGPDSDSNDDPGKSSTSAPSIPNTLPLNDDTLLEQTEFTSSKPGDAPSGGILKHIDPSSQPPLHPLDQSILLSLCLNVKNTSPSHGLTAEQMSPYVARVISHPRNWTVHTMALLLRSRLESNRTRTVERSTLQLQALIDQMPTSDSTFSERLVYFYSIPLPSKWELERELAKRYTSLGVTKSALEIFERLEMWEDVVKCWGSLERPDKGIAIVKDLLEGRKHEADDVLVMGKKTVEENEKKRQYLDAAREAKLWCLLGDLEPEKAVGYYTRAWEVSKNTSGRAMRSLGGYYFARGKYKEAVDCLKKAVAIHPLMTRSWFILGCSAMRLEEWEEAKNAFSRCVMLDEEDGESWSNLASMYLRLGTSAGKNDDGGNKEIERAGAADEDLSFTYSSSTAQSIPFDHKLLAFRALKQGLRYSYDNWRMWYNYMVVSMDVGELFEASRALGRVIEETSDKMGVESVDTDVLERLVSAVTRGSSGSPETNPAETESRPDESGAGGHSAAGGQGLLRSVSTLFTQTILPRISNSPRIFRAYARLLTYQIKYEEALKAYLDAYRCGAAGTFEKGESEVEKFREAVREVEETVDLLRNFGERVGASGDGGEGEGEFKWKLKARSIVRTFMGRAKDFEDEPEWERLAELLDELKKDLD